MADIANLDERTIKYTKRAVEAGLGEAVRDGVVSAKTAAEVARLPDAQRTEAVASIKGGNKPAIPAIENPSKTKGVLNHT